MNWTEPSEYWSSSVAHSVGGLIVTLLLAPAIRAIGLPEWGLLIPAALCGAARETYQFIKETNQFTMAVRNLAEWMFGGLVATILLLLYGVSIHS